MIRALPWVLAACMPTAIAAQTIDLSAYRMVDLTHSYSAQTLYWPNSPTSFQLQQLASGLTAAGYFYAANSLSTPEHGGTHLDAPIHFGANKDFNHQIPLQRLIAPVVVIDVTAQARANRDYRLTREDVLGFERQHGRIAENTIVLLRTGWSARWPNRREYLGDDTPGATSNLHFPSFGAEAARLLVDERRVAALGADVASTDYGPSTDFMVHRIMAAANVPGFENLMGLDQLPPRGALLIALPMKIEIGSGGPLRAVALIPARE